MAEVGEQDGEDRVAVGAYAFFQMYTGSLGYWSYAGSTPFMGLANLPDLIDFVRLVGWPEFVAELGSVAVGLQRFTPDQLAAYETFALDAQTHAEIDAIAFSEPLMDMMRDDHDGANAKFRAASEYLESTVDFMVFEDAASLRAWRNGQT